MRKRSRAHEAGSIEADSRKAKRFGFRWPGRAPRSDQSSQIEPARTPRRASSSQPGRQGQPDRASRGQIEPARAPGAARSSQSRPDRASQGEPGRSAGRPADRANPKLARPFGNFVIDIHSKIPKFPFGVLGGPLAHGRCQARFLARSCLVRAHL